MRAKKLKCDKCGVRYESDIIRPGQNHKVCRNSPRGHLQFEFSQGRAVAARVAHNHKVVGSIPTPATI